MLNRLTPITLVFIIFFCPAKNVAGQKIDYIPLALFRIPVDARTAAMEEAAAFEDHGRSTAMFFNPAGMTHLDGSVHTSLGYVNFDDMSYKTASAAVALKEGRYGTVGASFMRVNYNRPTRCFSSKDSFRCDTRALTATGASLGYAYSLTKRISAGFKFKYREQQDGQWLPVNGTRHFEVLTEQTAEVDLGLIADTDVKGLTFGLHVANLLNMWGIGSGSHTFLDLPGHLGVNASMNVLKLTPISPDHHALRLALHARYAQNPYLDHVALGAEYVWNETLALRTGYAVLANDELFPSITNRELPSLGMGLQRNFGGLKAEIDYAYKVEGPLGDAHRITTSISL